MNYTNVELFAGAGGLALGFEQAGIEHLLLIDNDRRAYETLQLNRPNWNIIKSDIHNYNFKDYAPDIISGGFPCQSFSTAGKGLGFNDPRGQLFFEFIRVVNETKPKILLAENVAGLTTHNSGETFNSILKSIYNLGYNLYWKILDANDYGVPQIRKRLIIVGVRQDIVLCYSFPKKLDYKPNLLNALVNVPESEGMKYSENKKKIMELIPPDGNWKNLPKEIQKSYLGKSFYTAGGKTGIAKRMCWDKPCLTLTTSPCQNQTERCHPDETRPFTIREYARIQTFPDDWKFTGSISSQYKQIGNAVPVNLAKMLGISLVNFLQKINSI
jgi:DNA (cytosine-5)-methyltransferase 1